LNNTQLCKLEECNPENIKLLKRYEMIMKNKQATARSIEAFVKFDIPIFLRFIKDKHVADVTSKDIEEFFFYCQSERNNGSEALSRKYTSLNSFYNQLIRKDYIDCKNILLKVDKPKVRKKPRGYLKPEEIKAMIDYAKSINDLRSLSIIELMYSSGCRISEIFQLNRDSINYTELKFTVLGKGDRIRTCVLSKSASDAILAYLDTRDDNLEPLFISREHNRLSRSAMRNSVKKIAKGAGIERNVFCHLLRHSIATNSIKAGVKLQDIKLLLGHSSISSTEIYAKQNILEVRNEFNKVYDQVQ